MKIGVINYSLGNIGSVISALRFYHYTVFQVKTEEDIIESDMVVLSGVGNFKTAVAKLDSMNLFRTLDEHVRDHKKPVLGICLGMQLFADYSTEGGNTRGFGWIPGRVEKMNEKALKIPHIGWNFVNPKGTSLFNSMRYGNFYYMHSYHFIPDDPSTIIGFTRYGDSNFVAAVRKENIVGVQFHPEKSQADGLRFLRNTVEELTCH